MRLSSFITLCFSQHARHPEYDERYAQELSHVEKHVCLEGFLYVFGILYDETEGEDLREAKPEEKALTNTAGMAAVHTPAHNEEHRVSDSFVQLSRMTGHHVHTFEHKRPRNVRNLAYDLAVHEVPQAYEACRERRGYGLSLIHI